MLHHVLKLSQKKMHAPWEPQGMQYLKNRSCILLNSAQYKVGK